MYERIVISTNYITSMIRNILLSILFTSCFSLSFAQNFNSNLIEFPIDSDIGDNYKVFPLGTEGLILFLKSNKIEKGEIQFVFSKLDNDLTQEWTRSFSLKLGTVVIDRFLTEKYLYFLVSPKPAKYQILQLDLETHTLNLIDYENIKDYFITRFKVVDDLCFFGGTIKSYPAVIGYNLKTSKKIILSSVNQLKADIVDLKVDKKDNVVSVVLFQSSPSNKRGLYINRYDFDGKLISNFFFKTAPGFRFLTYRAVIINPIETLFIGTYALRGSDEANGVYTMKVRGEETVFLKKHKFVEMDFFLKFLREKQQTRIRRKIAARKSKKKPLYFSYNTFMQPLTFRVDANEIIATVDIYNFKLDRDGAIVYIEASKSFAGYGSRMDPSLDRFVRANYNYKEFVPFNIPQERLSPNKPFPTMFEYEATVSCAFNIEGDILWSNTFVNDDDVQNFIPIHMTQTAALQDSLLMGQVIYTDDQMEEMRLKVTGYHSYTDSVYIEPLTPFIEGDEIESYDYGGFIHWYGNHFLSTGIKTVKNSTRRDVYFIRKITYNTK